MQIKRRKERRNNKLKIKTKIIASLTSFNTGLCRRTKTLPWGGCLRNWHCNMQERKIQGEGRGTMGEPAGKWGQGDEPKYASKGDKRNRGERKQIKRQAMKNQQQKWEKNLSRGMDLTARNDILPKKHSSLSEHFG